MKFGIYKWTNLITGRVLVGQTGSTVGFDKRKNRYINELSKNRWENKHFQRSWNKYGRDNFRFEMVEALDNDKILTEREQCWLDYYRALPSGVYNQDGPADNPRRGAKNSSEHNAKVSTANKGRLLGIKQSDVTIEKRASKLRGRSRSTEARAAISAGKKGKRFSEKHRLALSVSRKALMQNTNLRQRLSDRNKKRVIDRIDIITGECREYASICDAAREGFVKGHIIKCLKGERLTHKNYYWIDGDQYAA